jgi:hypothetical protein
MTGQEWLICTEPGRMLAWARSPAVDTANRAAQCQAYALSDRKLRLWVCGVAWALEDHARHPDWVKALGTAEAFADGLPTPFGPPKRGALEAARKSVDSAYGWLWCALHHDVSRGVEEAIRTARGFGARWRSAEAAALLRDVVGNPWRPMALPSCPRCGSEGVVDVPDGYVVPHQADCPVCRGAGHAFATSTVLDLAASAYRERGADGTLDSLRLAVLADALEEAGATDGALLRHLRSPGPHVRGCHVLDAVLGKE